MKFYVEDKVLDIGVKIVFAAVYDIDNHAVSDKWRSYREVKLKELLEELQKKRNERDKSRRSSYDAEGFV